MVSVSSPFLSHLQFSLLDTVKVEAWTRRSGDSLVVLLGRDELDRLVASRDRNALLKKFHADAVIAERG